MIKTKGGLTTASETKADLLKEFSGTAEALMRRAPITAEELIKAVKIAEMFAKIADLIDGIEEIDEGADDLGGMLEWLKGELENLEDESDD